MEEAAADRTVAEATLRAARFVEFALIEFVYSLRPVFLQWRRAFFSTRVARPVQGAGMQCSARTTTSRK